MILESAYPSWACLLRRSCGRQRAVHIDVAELGHAELRSRTVPLAAHIRVHPARERTATVLQPGRYKLVRSGRTLVGKPSKTLQKGRFSGHNRTG
jgi:hypothetical protein